MAITTKDIVAKLIYSGISEWGARPLNGPVKMSLLVDTTMLSLLNLGEALNLAHRDKREASP